MFKCSCWTIIPKLYHSQIKPIKWVCIKGKKLHYLSPRHDMALGWSRCMAPSILNLNAIWGTVGKYKTRRLYPTEINRSQLNWRRIGFRVLLEAFDKRNTSCFCRYSNPGPSRSLNPGSCHLLRIIVWLKSFAILKIIVRLAVRPILIFVINLT